MVKTSFAIVAMCLFGAASAAPIPVSGSGRNSFDTFDSVHTGQMSFGGTDGVDTIYVQVLGGSMPVSSFGETNGLYMQVLGWFNGVQAAWGTVSYNIGNGTGNVRFGAVVVPILGYFDLGPLVVDYRTPRGTAGHQDILVSPSAPVAVVSAPVPEPATCGVIAVALLVGARARRK